MKGRRITANIYRWMAQTLLIQFPIISSLLFIISFNFYTKTSIVILHLILLILLLFHHYYTLTPIAMPIAKLIILGIFLFILIQVFLPKFPDTIFEEDWNRDSISCIVSKGTSVQYRRWCLITQKTKWKRFYKTAVNAHTFSTAIMQNQEQ